MLRIYPHYISYMYIYIHYIHARIINKAERMVRPLLRRRGRVAEPRARSSVTRLVTSCREQHAIARSINRYLYIYVMNAIACRSRHGTAQRARPGACHAVRALPEIDVSGHGLPYSGFNILLTYNVIFKCSLNIFT